MVRDTGESYFNRHYAIEKLTDAGYTYGRDFEIMMVPNIVNITYGRDVGYKIEQEVLPKDIEAISATKIRANAGYNPV